MPTCPAGKVRRVSYKRKTSKGKKVSVKSGCIVAKGKAITRGKTTPKSEKILPKIGKDIELGKFGYGVHKSELIRRKALRDASRKHGDLPVLRYLVLINNYQADKVAKGIMKSDIEYLKLRYKKRN